MKYITAKLFLVLQILIIITMVTNLYNLETFIKGILIIYVTASLLKKKEEKNKSIRNYFILSIITVLLYGYYIELTFTEMITFAINQLYIPSTISFLINDHKKLNNIKARSHLYLTITTLILSIYVIVNKILDVNIIDNYIKVLLILLPLVLANLNKDNSLKNTIITVLAILALLISNLSIIVYLLILIGIVLSFVYKNKKETLSIGLSLIIIPIIYILFNDYIINTHFYADKTFFSILLEVIMYYIPLLYIIGKTTPNLKKLIKKNEQILYYYISIILIFMLGIYQSTIFYNPFYLLIYFTILTNYLNKIEIANKELNENEITILALHLGYGGIEQYLSSLCKMLEKDFEIKIISTYKLMKKPAFYFNDDIRIKYLIKEGPNKDKFKEELKKKNYFKVLKEGLKSIKLLYDKYILNLEEIENITSKYIITTRDFHNHLVGNYSRHDIITIATEHNYHNDDKKYIKKVTNSVKNVNYFVLVSENLKDFYKDKVNAKCIFIPNVLDTLPNKSTKSTKHNIISIGRLSKEKGQIDLIDVVKILKDKYKDIKLYLVGDGTEKENLSNYIKENKLDKNIELTGFLSKNDIELKLLDSKVFVTTSYTESFGLVVLEACSYKLPTVAFDSADGIKSLLSNGSGILVKKRNKKEMAKEIIKLFEDEKHYENISNNGYENCKKYLAKNVKKEWLKIIK